MKKYVILILIGLSLNALVISAIELEVTATPLSNTFIVELNEPAVFDLKIKNIGESDTFQAYSLVGINITHNPIFIKNGETKETRIYLTPQDSLRSNPQSFAFEYKIKNSKNEFQSETLTINIIKLESAFLITSEPISPESTKVTLDIKNNVIKELNNVNFKITSPFFTHEEIISFKPKEKKFIEVEVDLEKIKSISAGDYLMNSQITINKKIANIDSQIKFLEKEGIESSEINEGIIVKRSEIYKKNIGNTKTIVTLTKEKNVIEYIFTTTNIPASKIETKGLKKVYIWEELLIPNQEIKIITKTNWLYPIFILLILIAGIYLIKKSIYDTLELTKKVSFIKTKGGQFALKVTIKAKAKKSIDKISIIDKIPHVVKLYNKFGIIAPDKIDLENRRLHWDIDQLNKDETRIFTYIIYSKIGVVGRFELPEARGLYEDEGVAKEIFSNKSFYVNEPKE